MSTEQPAPNRRVQRTLQTLRTALMELVAERSYESLSVQDIAARANIGRATFYLHYPDKERLLLDCAEQVVAELAGDLAELAGADLEARALAMTRRTFDHVASHADLYRALMGERGVALLPARVRDLAAEVIARELRESFGPEVAGRPPYAALAQHTAGALLALVNWWLWAGMPGPTAELAALHWRLAAPGIAGALGLPLPER